MPDKLRPGDIVWHANRHGSGPEVIERVGNVWAYLENGGRINALTLASNDINGGRYFRSKQHHTETVVLERAWIRFCRHMNRISWPPPELTLDRLKQAADLLGITLGIDDAG